MQIARRVLLVHTRYQHESGEEATLDAEHRLLQTHGQDVELLEWHNASIGLGMRERLAVAIQTPWSWSAHRRIADHCLTFRPDLVHFHNTFPLVSPACYYAARASGAAVVQTLQNYRFLCPVGTFFRDGKICEECFTHHLGRGIVHRCYRGSRQATAVSAAVIALHRYLGSWHKQVDAYVVMTEFGRRKFASAGFPEERLFVKPHFVPDGPSVPVAAGRSGAMYIGRLEDYKGVVSLVHAWKQLPDVPLTIVGDGSLATSLRALAQELRLPNITFTGRLGRKAIMECLVSARLLVFPSLWYEPFGLVIAEAMACGVAVAAANQGGIAELVRNGDTGLLFEPGNADDLATKVRWLYERPEVADLMGRRGRETYETQYSPEPNYRRLIEIYEAAIGHRHQGEALA